MLPRGKAQTSNGKFNLLTNVFDVDCVPLIFNRWMEKLYDEYRLENFDKKWRAVIHNAGIDTRRFYRDIPLRRQRYECINVGGLYYFCFYFFLRYMRIPAAVAVQKMYEEYSDLSELKDICLFFHGGSCIVCEGAKVLYKAENFNGKFFDGQTLNETIRELIDEGLLRLINAEGNAVWTTKGVKTLCEVTRLLMKYLPTSM